MRYTNESLIDEIKILVERNVSIKNFTDTEIEDEFNTRSLLAYSEKDLSEFDDWEIQDEFESRDLCVVNMQKSWQLANTIYHDMVMGKDTEKQVRELIEGITGKLVYKPKKRLGIDASLPAYNAIAARTCDDYNFN